MVHRTPNSSDFLLAVDNTEVLLCVSKSSKTSTPRMRLASSSVHLGVSWSVSSDTVRGSKVEPRRKKIAKEKENELTFTPSLSNVYLLQCFTFAGRLLKRMMVVMMAMIRCHQVQARSYHLGSSTSSSSSWFCIGGLSLFFRSDDQASSASDVRRSLSKTFFCGRPVRT